MFEKGDKVKIYKTDGLYTENSFIEGEIVEIDSNGNIKIKPSRDKSEDFSIVKMWFYYKEAFIIVKNLKTNKTEKYSFSEFIEKESLNSKNEIFRKMKKFKEDYHKESERNYKEDDEPLFTSTPSTTKEELFDNEMFKNENKWTEWDY